MSAVAKGRMLAIEITPRRVRVLEFVPGTKPLQVTRVLAAERPGGEPAAVGKFLKEILAQAGIAARRALVAYSGPVIEHRIYALPPVASDAREELLRGKVAQDITTPIAEMRVSGEVVGKVVEQGTERQEVLTAYVPEFEIRRLTFLLIEAGVSPARVTSASLALAALHPAGKKDDIAAFVHAEPGRCSIAISNGGVLRFARDFVVDLPHRPEDGGPEPPDYGTIDLGGDRPGAPSGPSFAEAEAERMVTEITRSLLYFRQLSRGQAVTTLYWSGDPPSQGTRELISQRLKLSVSPHPAESVAPFPAGTTATPSEFGVPAGLAAAGQVPEQINLLPEGYLRRRKRRGRMLVAAVVAGVFVLAGVALFLGLHNAQVRFRAVLDDAVTAAGRRAGAQADFVAWVDLKRKAEEATAAEKGLRTPFLRWKTLFAVLGKAAPPDLTLSALTLERAGEGYRGDVRGRVRGKDPAEVQGRLNGFLAAIRAQGFGPGLAYLPQETRPLRHEEGRGYEQEFVLTFRIEGEG